MLEDNISDRDQSRCSLLLQSICEALGSARPRDRDDGGLGFRLELLRQGCQSPVPTTHQEQLLLMLQRHSHGWSALSCVLEQCCELEDRPCVLSDRNWSVNWIDSVKPCCFNQGCCWLTPMRIFMRWHSSAAKKVCCC